MNPILYRAFIGVIPYTFARPPNSPRTMLHSPVKTPCIGVCSTGIGDSVCRGCKRFSHEVIDWNSYSQEQKRIYRSRGFDRAEFMDDSSRLAQVDASWFLQVSADLGEILRLGFDALEPATRKLIEDTVQSTRE